MPAFVSNLLIRCHALLPPLWVLTAAAFAGDAASVDPDLPQPLDPRYAQELLSHSPFTRPVSLEDSLQLTGMAYVDGRPVVTVFNKDTKRSVVVSEEPNALGWQLTHATSGSELADTEVEMRIGPEIVTMHYGDAQMSPGATKAGAAAAYAAGHPKSDKERSLKTSSYLGKNGRELYAALSSEGRDKLKDAVRAFVAKHPERTMAESSVFAQKIYARIKATDAGAKSNGVKASKPGKTAKRAG